MRTRDRSNYKKCYFHHFLAANLVKILFKQSVLQTDDILISRYHQTQPMTVRNPLTNEVVVGEVEFYHIKCPEE